MKPISAEGPIATDNEPPSKKHKINGARKWTKHEEPTIDNNEAMEES